MRNHFNLVPGNHLRRFFKHIKMHTDERAG